MRAKWCWLVGFGFVSLWVSVGWGASSVSRCISLYKTKSFEKAATCFQQHAKTLSTQTPLQRYTKGRMLRNAVQSLQKAVQSLPNRSTFWSRRALLRERAVTLLQQVLEQSLYEDVLTKDLLKKEVLQIQKQIGYVSLSLLSRFADTSFCLLRRVEKGSPAKPLKPRCKTGKRWKLRLIPGRYLLNVTVPGTKFRKQRKLSLFPSKSMSVEFSFRLTEANAQLEVKSPLTGVRVYLNGEYKGMTPLKLVVAAGKHRLEWKKTCYRTIKQTIALRRKQSRIFSATLKRDPVFLGWQQRKRENVWRGALGWSLIGTTVVAAAVMVASYSLAESNYAAARDEYLVFGRSPTFLETGERSNTFRTVGHVTMGVSAVALGGGIWQLLSRAPSNSSRLPCEYRAPRTHPSKTTKLRKDLSPLTEDSSLHSSHAWLEFRIR